MIVAVGPKLTVWPSEWVHLSDTDAVVTLNVTCPFCGWIGPDCPPDWPTTVFPALSIGDRWYHRLRRRCGAERAASPISQRVAGLPGWRYPDVRAAGWTLDVIAMPTTRGVLTLA